jgi:hypothetical protein
MAVVNPHGSVGKVGVKITPGHASRRETTYRRVNPNRILLHQAQQND